MSMQNVWFITGAARGSGAEIARAALAHECLADVHRKLPGDQPISVVHVPGMIKQLDALIYASSVFLQQRTRLTQDVLALRHFA